MTKIKDSKGRLDENSGYTRLLGNPHMGHLLSQTHSTSIRNGNELGHILAERASYPIVTLDHVLAGPSAVHGDIEIVPDAKLPVPGHRDIETDILIIDHYNRTCRVIEVKDGDTFDTKKANGELESLTSFAAEIERRLGYTTTYHFCSFNQPNKAAIVKGAKNRFLLSEVMTGREICELLGIDYEQVIEYRKLEQRENQSYFLDQLLEIPEVRRQLLAKLYGTSEGTNNDQPIN